MLEGAYFAQSLALARQEGRISKRSADPLLRMKQFLALGRKGTKAEAFVMWVDNLLAAKSGCLTTMKPLANRYLRILPAR